MSTPTEEPTLNEISNTTKWLFSILIGIVFAIIASPALYCVTNALISKLSGAKLHTTSPGGATLFGLILHAIVFAVIVRIMLL